VRTSTNKEYNTLWWNTRCDKHPNTTIFTTLLNPLHYQISKSYNSKRNSYKKKSTTLVLRPSRRPSATKIDSILLQKFLNSKQNRNLLPNVIKEICSRPTKKTATFNSYKRVIVSQAPEEINSISKKHLLTQD
jgi:hypothetical protein